MTGERLASAVFLFLCVLVSANATDFGFNHDRTVYNKQDLVLRDLFTGAPSVAFSTHLHTMATMGGRVVRLFLSLDTILDGPLEANQTALEGLDRILQAVQNEQMKALLCGANWEEPLRYYPQWLAAGGEEGLVTAQVFFWRTLAARYKASPLASAIYGFDIQNEPAFLWNDASIIVSGCLPTGNGGNCMCYDVVHNQNATLSWNTYVHSVFKSSQNLSHYWPDYPLPGESWGHILIPSNPWAMDPRTVDYRVHLSLLQNTWCKSIHDAVRLESSTIPITYGALFPSNTAVCAEYVDWHQVHLYPALNSTTDQIFSYFHSSFAQVPNDGKLILIGELMPLMKGPQLDAMWSAVAPRVKGILSFYWGNSTEMGWDSNTAQAWEAYYQTFSTFIHSHFDHVALPVPFSSISTRDPPPPLAYIRDGSNSGSCANGFP